MPNWCAGNLRLRGKRSAIKEFLANELESVCHRRGVLGVQTAPIIIEDDGYEIAIKRNVDDESLFPSIYIKGTRRNFIRSKGFEVYFDANDEGIRTVCIDDVEAAWCFEAAPYLEKTKKYGIDIRIVGFECGMEFEQEIEIVNGELVKDDEIKYDDWLWECPMPNMGG